MNAREALSFIESATDPLTTHYLGCADAIATLRECVEACEAAMEWAAGFPHATSLEFDIDCAADVYQRCEAALKGDT